MTTSECIFCDGTGRSGGDDSPPCGVCSGSGKVEDATGEPTTHRPPAADLWQQTFSGVAFTACEPRPEDVRAVDIVHALSQQCRFGGHCRQFYSVASHSLLVLDLVTQAGWGLPEQRAALMHDAAETYVVDLPSPIKRSGMVGDYAELEARCLRAVAARFGFDFGLVSSPAVKEADALALRLESEALFGKHPKPWVTDALLIPFNAGLFWEHAKHRVIGVRRELVRRLFASRILDLFPNLDDEDREALEALRVES